MQRAARRPNSQNSITSVDATDLCKEAPRIGRPYRGSHLPTPSAIELLLPNSIYAIKILTLILRLIAVRK